MGTGVCGNLSHIVHQQEERYTVCPIGADKWLTGTNVFIQYLLWIVLRLKRTALS